MIANQSRKRKGFLEPVSDSPFGSRWQPMAAGPPFAPCGLRPETYFINFVTASV